PKTGKSIEILTLKETIYEKERCAVRRCFSE
ncbi:peptidase, partial [Enterobacter mori]